MTLSVLPMTHISLTYNVTFNIFIIYLLIFIIREDMRVCDVDEKIIKGLGGINRKYGGSKLCFHGTKVKERINS